MITSTTRADRRLPNALTVDVEDYFHVTGLARQFPPDRWDQLECRVEASTHRILELLQRHQTQATFFVLGWVAERYPQLVREIDAAGHEIGSHGYWHRLVYDLSPDQFRGDVRRARDVLEDLVGRPVTSFRAPSFSITHRSRWALEILVEEGFRIDSSISPVHHDRDGVPAGPPKLHQISTPSGPIWELPPTVVCLGGVNLAAAGGGYFRLVPWWLTQRCLRWQQQAGGRPLVLYVHPWELDPGQPRVRGARWTARFRHYVNLHTTAGKVDRLLAGFRFGRVCDIVEQMAAHPSFAFAIASPDRRYRSPIDLVGY